VAGAVAVAALPIATVHSVTTTVGEPASIETPARKGAAPTAVSLAHVSKHFRLPHEQYHTFKERALHPFRARVVDVLQAVDDVSLEIGVGEFFGIVGRNGSGKSTLLKCLAGIYDTDAGSLEVNGRLSPFIELGVGFNPDLTARDNVIINAIMLGLSRKQARERFDDIVAFAELEEFMDLKLKNYSSGMQVRLAFSVAIQVDAEIVLIDEVLAVGDASFQQKCFDEFTRLKAAGRTIVFVTHDMGSVERFCDRAMVMERGRVVEIGDPGSIARRYNELNFRSVRKAAREHGGPEALRRAPVAELLNAWFEDSTGEKIVSAAQGELCFVRMDVRFHADTQDPLFSLALKNDLGHTSFAASSQLRYGPSGSFRAGDQAAVRIQFENWLGPGRYRLTASITRSGLGADAYDLREDISSIIVHASQPGGGAADLPHSFEIERG
jgi:ABC-type polysaccharide/polyol phosphate transport system ATPase subunit